jgi:Xaa-Pro aminopeptidase
MQIDGFSAAQLDAFRRHQRASYDTLERAAATLRAGDTEIDVARRLRRDFRQQGVRVFFHVPVALFGDRTAYPGDFGALGALPTPRALEPGMPVILDAAPIYDGYTVDTSYAFSFGANAVQDRLRRDLEPFRALLLERVRAGVSFRAIAREVDTAIRDLGYRNCHRKHIGAVLGHRVQRDGDGWLHHRRVWGLSATTAAWFLGRSLVSEAFGGDASPNWNHSRRSDHPPAPGLWAVEPHLGTDQCGAKFEEILVITRDGARWLDDDLPHHRFWRAAS